MRRATVPCDRANSFRVGVLAEPALACRHAQTRRPHPLRRCISASGAMWKLLCVASTCRSESLGSEVCARAAAAHTSRHDRTRAHKHDMLAAAVQRCRRNVRARTRRKALRPAALAAPDNRAAFNTNRLSTSVTCRNCSCVRRASPPRSAACGVHKRSVRALEVPAEVARRPTKVSRLEGEPHAPSGHVIAITPHSHITKRVCSAPCARPW